MKDFCVDFRELEAGQTKSGTQLLGRVRKPVDKSVQFTIGTQQGCNIRPDVPFLAPQQGIFGLKKPFLRSYQITYTDTSTQGSLLVQYDKDTDQLAPLSTGKLIHNQTVTLTPLREVIVVMDGENNKGFMFLPFFL